jgi:glycosyltransferase involved in cell wall biosynthesis
MTEAVRVVEPTLEDESGHCHSFIGAVAAAGPDQRFEIWAGRGVGPLFPDLPQVTLHPHFFRRVRRIQALLLYRRLLRTQGRVFVPTASTTDVELAALVAPGVVPPGKATFFFHWIRPSARKRRRLARVARRQPHLRVLGAAEEIVALLREAGFEDARLVPYPVSTRALPPEGPPAFRHVLFAGAARRDKGFHRVVDFVALLKSRGEEIPVSVQTSTRHYGKGDSAIAEDVERLMRIDYPGLRSQPETLDTDAYLGTFHGAICLQPYDREEFAGRVSAVTVDALASGSPVITTAETWMARTVERRECGVALRDLSAEAIYDAVRAVIDDYDRYSANARKAADAVKDQNSGAHLLNAVLS